MVWIVQNQATHHTRGFDDRSDQACRRLAVHVAVCALARLQEFVEVGEHGDDAGREPTGGGDPGRTGAASAPAAASAATGTTATTAATKVTCSQLTFADVQPLMVDKITAVAVTAAGQTGEGQTCNWAYAGSSAGMSITVLSGQDATDTFNGDVQSLSKAISVPGSATRLCAMATTAATPSVRSRAASTAG